MQNSSGFNRLSLVEFGAIVYLVAPLLLFCASFLLLPIAIVSCAIIAFALYKCARDVNWTLRPRWTDVALLVIAFAWTTLAGITPFLVQNSDWDKHYAVLNLLVEHDWPPQFEGQYLRYSLGYYLVPALLAKPFNFSALEWIVGVWTIAGVWLALKLLTIQMGERTALLFSVVFIFFSGMDYFGTQITGHQIGPVYHFEWWATFAEIPSNMTTLFWAPQHGLPAWIGIGLLLKSPTSLKFGALILAAVFFWSPFVPIGLSPFILWASWGRFRELVSVLNILPIFVLIVVAIYLETDAAEIPRAFIWSDSSVTPWRFLLFTVLEWGALALALWFAGADRRLLAISSAFLLAISCVWFGSANDLIMRASVPALAVLAVLTIQSFQSWRVIPAVIILLLGVPTGLGEIYRAMLFDRVDLHAASFSDPQMRGLRYQYFSERPVVIRR